MTNHVVEGNLLRLKQEIVPYTPRIVAVTKYYDTEAILDAYKAGLRDFGESRANDAIKKIEELPDEIRKESNFHFIGHLQTNKVDKVVKYFDYIQSVDSIHLARAISDSAIKHDKIQKILLQVNISEEIQKYGFEQKSLKVSFKEICKLENLKIEGLMCMAPFGANDTELDRIFSRAKNLLEELNKDNRMEMQELSMGMSDDYKRAVVNGATIIRVGRLLFN